MLAFIRVRSASCWVQKHSWGNDYDATMMFIQAFSHLQGREESRQRLEDAHAVLAAQASELKRQLATADAAALLAQQQAADNESFACIRESLSNQVRKT